MVGDNVVNIGASFVLGRGVSSVRLSIHQVSQYPLRAGIDGRLASLAASECDLDPVLSTICPVHQRSLVCGQGPASREGRVSKLRLVPALSRRRLAGVIFEDGTSQPFVSRDGSVLLGGRSVTAEDNLDGGRRDGSLGGCLLLHHAAVLTLDGRRGSGSGLVVNPVAKELVCGGEGGILAASGGCPCS